MHVVYVCMCVRMLCVACKFVVAYRCFGVVCRCGRVVANLAQTSCGHLGSSLGHIGMRFLGRVPIRPASGLRRDRPHRAKVSSIIAFEEWRRRNPQAQAP